MKSHKFEVHGGNQPKAGKARWQDRLTIDMDWYFAWQLAESILLRLQCLDENVIYSVYGKLDYDVDIQANSAGFYEKEIEMEQQDTVTLKRFMSLIAKAKDVELYNQAATVFNGLNAKLKMGLTQCVTVACVPDHIEFQISD